MENLTIGCALTTWNSNDYLEEQLETLTNQLKHFDEVIIVDDASTNDTIVRLNKWIEDHHLENWQIFRHEKNQGFIRTFQDALSHSNSDVIFLCDHDDLWHQDKTQIMADEFQKNPDIQVLACTFDLIDANANPIEDTPMKNRANHNLIHRSVNTGELNQMSAEDIMSYNFAPGCTMALRKELAQDYLDLVSNIEITLPHDWAISMIAALKDGLYYLDKPLMGYRQHVGNTLGLARKNEYDARLKVAKDEAEQKQSLLRIMEQFDAPKEQQEKMKRVARIYSVRADSLEHRKIFPLIRLLFSSQAKGMKLTIGMDLKTILFS